MILVSGYLVLTGVGHVHHEEKAAWFSISMHAYGSGSIVMVLHRGSAINLPNFNSLGSQVTAVFFFSVLVQAKFNNILQSDWFLQRAELFHASGPLTADGMVGLVYFPD